MSKTVENKENIAFSSNESLKKAIGSNEFESVIKIVTCVVEKIKKANEERNNSKKRALELINSAKSHQSDEQNSEMIKVVKKELSKTDREVYKGFKDEFDNACNAIDFLNRFKQSDQLIEKPNLKWVEKAKNNLK